MLQLTAGQQDKEREAVIRTAGADKYLSAQFDRRDGLHPAKPCAEVIKDLVGPGHLTAA